MPPLTGGSAAPPIGDEKLSQYRDLAEDAPAEVREAMLELCLMVEKFLETPTTPSDKLTPAEAERLWEVIPWQKDCDAIQSLFDTLPNGPKESPEWKLRNAAFHLIWYAQHLTKDLEPLTLDRL